MTSEETVEVIQHANVYEAMAAAMQDCGYVQKHRGKGDELKYTFAGEADMIQEIRPVLVRHGLFIVPSKVVDLRVEQYTTSRGSQMNLVTVTQQFTIAHSSGTFITVETVGAGADIGDKAAPKANTGAFKYALRQSFTIETGDDPDNTPSDIQARGGAQNRRAGDQSQSPMSDPLDGIDRALWALDAALRAPDAPVGVRWVVAALNGGEEVPEGNVTGWWKQQRRSAMGAWLDASPADESDEAAVKRLISVASDLKAAST